MTPVPVHILATCRKPELLPATTMVFDTLRVGFPSAKVNVWWNGMDGTEEYKATAHAAKVAGVENFYAIAPTIHHKWIETLLREEQGPFFILDTDVSFWKPFEGFDFSGQAIAGRFIPQFFDKFTNCITRARLHTSLMYFNPNEVTKRTDAYFAQFPRTEFNPRPNLLYPVFYPARAGNLVRNYFHDTACLLYQAIGGQAFTESQLECYDHLQFGTISDLVCPSYPEHGWREDHFTCFENREFMKGSRKKQDAFYAQHAA